MKKILAFCIFLMPLFFLKIDVAAQDFTPLFVGKDYTFYANYPKACFYINSNDVARLYVSDSLGTVYNNAYIWMVQTSSLPNFDFARSFAREVNFYEDSFYFSFGSWADHILVPYFYSISECESYLTGNSWTGDFASYVPTPKLFRTNSVKVDDLGNIVDSKCYIWANTDLLSWVIFAADTVEYKLYVNDSYKATFKKSFTFNSFWSELDTLISFNYSDYNIVNNDRISIQAKFKVTDLMGEHFGLTSSLVWNAQGKDVKPVSQDPLVNRSVVINDIDVTTITENNTYIVYDVDNNISLEETYVYQSYVGDTYYNDYITNNISNITNNTYYNTNININYGEGDADKFNLGKLQLENWVSELISYINPLYGTPFEFLATLFISVISVLVAFAFIFVLIKIVGLIL